MFSTFSPRIVAFTDLTNIFFSNVFVNKSHTASRLSFVNALGLNKLLRSKIFVSEDGQLRAAYLILEYEPISRIYQGVGQAIKTGDSRLAWIDVSKPGVLSRRDLPPVELHIQRTPPQVVALREESASSRHTLDAEIDWFRFEDAEGAPERFVELSDSEHESDRFSTAHPPKLIVAQVDTSSEVEEEGMDLKLMLDLKGVVGE